MFILPIGATSSSAKGRMLIFPLAAGIVAALGMLSFYLAILSLLQSPEHAVAQLAVDRAWVALVALGFGGQIVLLAYLRVGIRTAQSATAAAASGVGTGTSTLGMVACCAHHLSDLAPLLGLSGAAGISSAVGFLTEWRYGLILLGLGVNAVGIVVTARKILSRASHVNNARVDEEEGNSAPALICRR